MRGARILLLLGCMLFLAGAVLANPMIPDERVTMRLGPAEVYLPATIDEVPCNIARIPVYVTANFVNDPQHNLLSEVKVQVHFDEPTLQLATVKGTPEPTFWDATVVGARPFGIPEDEWIIQFDANTITPSLPIVNQLIGYIQVYVTCDFATHSPQPVNLIYGGDQSQITALPAGHSFGAWSGESGSVSLAAYTADFTLGSPTVTNGISGDVVVPVTATTNYRVYSFEHHILYNSSKLVLDPNNISTSVCCWSTPPTIVPIAPGHAKVVGTADWVYGLDEFVGVNLYNLHFTPQCNVNNQYWDTAIVSFGTMINRTGFCNEYEAASTPHAGTITLTDVSHYVGQHLETNTYLSKSDANRILNFRLSRQSTFDVGPLASNGRRLALNMDFKASGLSLIDMINTEFTWAWEGSGAHASLNEGGTSVLTRAETPVPVTDIRVSWNPTLFLYPSWDTRFIRPEFIATYTEADYSTQMPSASCAGTRGDEALVLQPFENDLEIRMLELKAVGNTSQSSCSYENYYLRSNFEVGRCNFRLTLYGNKSISSLSYDPNVLTVETIDPNHDYRIRLKAGEFGPNPVDPEVPRFFLRANLCRTAACPPKYSRIGVSPGITMELVQSFTVPFPDDTTFLAEFNSVVRPVSATVACGEVAPDPVFDKQTTGGLPTEFSLEQNYPNPFNPVTTISLSLPKASAWKISIFNVSGQLVKEFEGTSGAGVVSVQWDASQSASGVYIYKAIAGDFTDHKKMLLVK